MIIVVRQQEARSYAVPAWELIRSQDPETQLADESETAATLIADDLW